MREKFNYAVIKSFLSEGDIKSFLVWDNIFRSGSNIIAIYRAPFEERISIPISEYEAKVRDLKLDDVLN